MERRLVVVDPGLYGHAEWLRLVELTGASLLSLQPDLDGPQQIADFLSASADRYDSLHLLSHGSPGMLHVGASLLSASNLDLFRPVLAQIGSGLATDGDILIYGCEVASGEVGRQFIEALAEATSADVAASAQPVSGKSPSIVDASDDAITESERSLLAAPLLEQRVGSVESSPLSLTGLGVLGVNTAPGFAWATGKVTASPGIDDLATVVLQQADGKIIIAGTSTYRWSNSFGSGISTQFAITRYNANGTQDGTFVGDYSGDPDRALETTGFANGSGDTALQQASGPVVFAGKTAGNLALLRLASTGALDSNFGTSGILQTDFGSNFDCGNAILERPDGSLVVAGGGGASGDFILAVFDSSGGLDPSFGTGGKVVTDFGGDDIARGLVRQGDGKLVAIGTSAGNIAIARYLSNGSLDTEFDGDGKAIIDLGGSDAGSTVFQLPDNKLLVLAQKDSDLVVMRLNANGSLDTTFGIAGKQVSSLFTRIGRAIVQPDSKLVVVGESANAFLVARFLADGSLDSSFNDNGYQRTSFKANGDAANAVYLQSDGKILVAGAAGTGYSSTDFAMARYESDGRLDLSFGPIIRNLATEAAYTENSSPVILSPVVDVRDVELELSGSYSGATLTLKRQGGAQAQDLFSGSGITAGSASGTLVVESATIAEYTYASGELVIRFNAQATGPLVDQALSAIAYSNSSDAPLDNIPIEWTFNDGNIAGAQGEGGALSVSEVTTVKVTQLNDSATGSVRVLVADQSGLRELTGRPSAGQLLVAQSTVSDPDGMMDVRYVWQADGVTRQEGGSPQYTISAADAGKYISVTQKFYDRFSSSNPSPYHYISFYSTNGAVINSPPGGTVSISGEAAQGQELVASHTLTDADNGLGPIISYTWKADGAIIAGVTGDRYTLTQAEVGKTITVTASYQDGYQTPESKASAPTVPVANINDAPILAPRAPALQHITEDEPDSEGQTVASLLGDGLNDIDASALKGIAIHQVTGAHGRWQYRVADASEWSEVGMVSPSAALLLGSNDLMRFVPDGLAGTTATIGYYGWDQSSGVAGSRVPVSARGAATAFSIGGDVATLPVGSVNDAPTFVLGDGKVVTAASDYNDGANAIAIQPDGKVILGGQAISSGKTVGSLLRYNNNGSLDTSFDGDGKLLNANLFAVNAVVVLGDGRILMAGTGRPATDNDFVLARYHPDGSLDVSFDGDGVLKTDFGATTDQAYCAAVQPDGRVVVAGQRIASSGVQQGVIARYNEDGSLDTSFNVDGFDYSANGSVALSVIRGLAVQPDGRIVVAGSATVSGKSQFALARYNADGTLDPGFGSGGIVTTVMSAGPDNALSLAIQSDGKLVVAGSSQIAWDNYDFAIARYHSGGSLDTAFAGDGTVVTSIRGGEDKVNSVAVQADGKILVGGSVRNASNAIVRVLARYKVDGTLDSTFGAGGILTSDLGLGNGTGDGNSLLIQPDGPILLPGSVSSGNSSDSALIRFNPDGSPDLSFDSVKANTLGAKVNFTENSLTAVVLDNDVAVHDPELTRLGSYDGAVLTLMRRGGPDPQDRFLGTGTIGSLASGSNITISGVVIAKVLTNAAGTLSIEFDGPATQSLVNTLMRGIAYTNASDAPPPSVTIDWTFSDGNAGAQGTGPALSATGTSTVEITPLNDPPTGGLSLTGPVVQGKILSTSSHLADPDGLGPITYTWKADGATIAGVTGDRYTLTQAEVGKTITVTASYTDSGGTPESVTSAATVPVEPAPAVEPSLVHHWKNHAVLSASLLDSLVEAVAAGSGGAISSADAMAALKIALGRNPNPDPDGPGPQEPLPVSPYQLIAADLDADGVVSRADAQMILRLAQGTVDAAPAEWVFAAELADLSVLSKSTAALPTGAEVVPAALSQSGHAVAVLRGDVDGSWGAPDGSDILPLEYYQALVDIPDTTLTLAQFGIVAMPAV